MTAAAFIAMVWIGGAVRAVRRGARWRAVIWPFYLGLVLAEVAFASKVNSVAGE